MKKIAIAAVALVAIPMLARAQGAVAVNSRARATADASSSVGEGRAGLSAEAQSQISADLATARRNDLPEEPIRRRVAEGQAKGASEAQIVAASGSTLVKLQSAHDAMVRAGRDEPTDAETSRGAELLASGFTSAQLEAVTRRAPAERSLVVALDVLASLHARGVSTGRAAEQLQRNLAARVTDAALRGLAVNGEAMAATSAAVGVGGGAAGSASGRAAGGGAASVGAAGSAASGAARGVAGGATASVGAGIGGMLGRP